MDRLPTLIIVVAGALGLGGCESPDKHASGPPATAARTDGAKVAQPQAASPDAFCDLHKTDANGLDFKWPQLAAGESAPAAATTWRWVNVWATWCKPCVEEMPRIAAWRDKLAAAGKQVDLQFVSVDDSDDDIAEFRKSHPGTPTSLRITDAAQRGAWLKTFGLDDGAIPIQLFVSAAGKLRCTRAGGVREKDYAVVEKLLSE